jgi:DegV family protein with EDD domain
MTNSSKKPIGVVVDEACDLPKELIERHRIGIVPLNVHWPEIEGIPGENIFQKIREIEKRGDKSFAKTSQPSPKAFLDVFKKQLENFEKLICLTITSKHSGTYNSGCQAKRFLGKEGEKVFIVDSLNGTGGLGLIVLKVADLIEKGKKSVEEILRELENFIPQVHLYAMLEDPKRLEASGRISSMVANWIRRAQKIGIRPLIGLKKGTITAIGIKTRAKDIPTALFHEIEAKTKELRAKGKKIRVAITHGDNLERAQKLKEMIEKDLENTEVAFVNLIDNILGAILGPDALALAWAPVN